MYHVYILASLKDVTKVYIGITTDLDQRIHEHFEKYLKSGSGYAFLKKRLL